MSDASEAGSMPLRLVAASIVTVAALVALHKRRMAALDASDEPSSAPPNRNPSQSSLRRQSDPGSRAFAAEDEAMYSSTEFRNHLQRYTLNGNRRGSDVAGNTGPVVEHLDSEDSATITRYKPNRRSTVSGPSTNLAETRQHRPVAYPKSANEEADLRRWLRSCQLFSQLDDDEMGIVIAAMSRVDFVQGNFITLQGDAIDADTERFMVIASGEVSVIKDGTVLRILRQGQFFGERHLMFVHSACKLTHRVDTPRCQCFALNADDYRHIVTRVAVDKSELYEGFLDRVTWLRGLTHREKMQLADSLQPVIYNDGDYLIEYDTIGVWLYLLVEGQVEVFGRKNGEIVSVCTFGVGDCVGELEFMNNHRTVADVRARGRVKAARLHRDHFELCMGPIVDVLRRTSAGDERFAYYRALLDGADDAANASS